MSPGWYLWDPAWTVFAGSVPTISQHHGRSWVAVAADEPPEDPCPHGLNASWTTRELRGTLFDALENFLDPMHTPFIHAGIVRSEGARRPVDVDILCDGVTVSATYRGARRSGLIRRSFGLGIDRTVGRFRPPGIVELDYFAGEVLRLRILLAFAPLEPGRLGLTVGLFTPIPRWISVPLTGVLGPLLEVALRQDARIIALKFDHEQTWFPDRLYVHTDADLLGPFIQRFATTGQLVPTQRTVRVQL